MFIVNYKQKSERCGLVIKKPNSNSEKLEGIGSRTWKINGTGYSITIIRNSEATCRKYLRPHDLEHCEIFCFLDPKVHGSMLVTLFSKAQSTSKHHLQHSLDWNGQVKTRA